MPVVFIFTRMIAGLCQCMAWPC